jgi:hypothetical protein
MVLLQYTDGMRNFQLVQREGWSDATNDRAAQLPRLERLRYLLNNLIASNVSYALCLLGEAVKSGRLVIGRLNGSALRRSELLPQVIWKRICFRDDSQDSVLLDDAPPTTHKISQSRRASRRSSHAWHKNSKRKNVRRASFEANQEESGIAVAATDNDHEHEASSAPYHHHLGKNPTFNQRIRRRLIQRCH